MTNLPRSYGGQLGARGRRTSLRLSIFMLRPRARAASVIAASEPPRRSTMGPPAQQLELTDIRRGIECPRPADVTVVF